MKHIKEALKFVEDMAELVFVLIGIAVVRAAIEIALIEIGL